jgi:hypothetical protein
MARLQTLWYDRMNGLGRHSDLTNPMFDAATYVHDWRNHVGTYVRQIWKSLDGEQRAAIALDADEKARKEDWD